MLDTCYCPSCHCELRLSAELAGRQVSCPRCRTLFVAPADETGPPPNVVAAESWPGPPARVDDHLREGRRTNREAREEVLDRDEHWEPRVPLPDSLPGQGLTVATVTLLGLTILATLGAMAANYSQYQLLARMRAGARPAQQVLEANDTVVRLTALAQFACLIATAVLFACWFYRSHKNLQLWRTRDLLYTPGWAAGAFFVPILNLFRPYQIAQEIWKGSDPAILLEDRSGWRRAPGSNLLGVWWASWIIAGVLDRTGFAAARDDKTVASLQTATVVAIIADLAAVVAGLLAMTVVWQIHARQVQKLQESGEQNLPEVAPAK